MLTIPELLSEYQEDEDQELTISANDIRVHFLLSDYHAKYLDSGNCDGEEEEKVKKSMIGEFCEDFKEFLINRKEILSSMTFYIQKNKQMSDDTYIHNQIFDCMESALKSRSDKLRVKNLHLDKFDTKQQIALLKLMNPEMMTSIYFETPDIEEAVNFLVEWNKGDRLDVKFKLDALSIEILSFLKKTLNYSSVFSRISLEHKGIIGWTKEQGIAFFKPFKPSVYHWRMVSFSLKDPSENLNEQIDRLSLQDPRLMEVFGNPLLMEIILKEIGFFDIQCLRKVSRDIRSCIDALKSNPDITGYSIDQHSSKSIKQDFSDSIDIGIDCRTGANRCIRYQSEELLHNKYDWKVDYFVNCGDQLFERVVNDFKINIEHQKSRMNYFKCNGKILELIGTVLKSRDTPLNVERLRIKVTNENDIMKILPYLDSVESIYIHFDSTINVNLAEVLKLKQWKNFRIFELMNCTVMNSIQELNIINFRRINIRIDSISTDDVIYLKENLIKSDDLDSFEISFNESLIDETLYTFLPPYDRDPGFCDWRFPMSDLERTLYMTIQENQIIFRSVNRYS